MDYRLGFGWLLILSIGLSGCFSSAPDPTPTLSFLFATITPMASEVAGNPSPEVTVTPSLTAVATSPADTPTPESTPTPVVVTATPEPRALAVVNSPNGFLNIRSGPGLLYNPPLGTYNNGVVAEILGKQYDANEDLWWLIRFNSGTSDRGWIYANYTRAEHVANVPWVTAPPVPTAVVRTPQPTPTPHAIINSPDGVLAVRSGPGRLYEPPLGSYQNGATVPILGKQFAPDDNTLWWLIPFSGSPTGQGWIFANFTIARAVNTVPLVNAPPTPTRQLTATPTSTPTSENPATVRWSIQGRVVDSVTAQPIKDAAIKAILGSDGLSIITVSDVNGNFSLQANARNAGDLTVTITADGYVGRTVTVGPTFPREYTFSTLELIPQEAPAITWLISGQVTEIGGTRPISDALVVANLGVDAIQVTTRTDAAGKFSMDGNAADSGVLSLEIIAEGYQPQTFVSNQTETRIYTLLDLKMVPLAGSCAYESVINLPSPTALARLQNLNFTTINTTTVTVNGNLDLVGLVLTQAPNPPPEGQSLRISCQLPIMLGIGASEG